ncbi:MAG: hypothetical protein P4M13_01285 [Alphaproteobacteria bacterium]|nr:hypothetical protein [Alphaproteobacteria bacterium]
MSEKVPYWASVLFSAVALVLLVVNISISNANRAQQTEVAARQNAISGGQALGQLNQSLVQAMAEAAVKNNDLQLRDLLSSQGIKLKSEPVAEKSAEKSEKKKEER